MTGGRSLSATSALRYLFHDVTFHSEKQFLSLSKQFTHLLFTLIAPSLRNVGKIDVAYTRVFHECRIDRTEWVDSPRGLCWVRW